MFKVSNKIIDGRLLINDNYCVIINGVPTFLILYLFNKFKITHLRVKSCILRYEHSKC